jgi:hypothetical protein
LADHKDHEGKPRIIARTPTFKPSEMTSLGCIVIREYEDEYVVHHAEVEPASSLDPRDERLVSFYWGHYFKKDRCDALERAVESFIVKAIRWYNLRDRFTHHPDGKED